MIRLIFAVAAVLSLLLCVAVCVLWVRSYRLTDSVELLHHSGAYSIESAAGRVKAIVWPGSPYGAIFTHSEPFEFRSSNDHPLFDVEFPTRYGFGYQTTWILVEAPGMRAGNFGPKYTSANQCILSLAAPHAFAAAVLFMFPSFWACSEFRRRRRQRNRCCGTCGYDLRASTELCPECGTVIRSTTATAA